MPTVKILIWPLFVVFLAQTRNPGEPIPGHTRVPPEFDSYRAAGRSEGDSGRACEDLNSFNMYTHTQHKHGPIWRPPSHTNGAWPCTVLFTGRVINATRLRHTADHGGEPGGRGGLSVVDVDMRFQHSRTL